HFLIVPVGIVIGARPLFPGGAGIAEAGFGGLYEWFSFAMQNGTLGSLVNRVMAITFGLLGFAIYRWQMRHKAIHPITHETPRAKAPAATPWPHTQQKSVTTTRWVIKDECCLQSRRRAPHWSTPCASSFTAWPSRRRGLPFICGRPGVRPRLSTEFSRSF